MSAVAGIPVGVRRVARVLLISNDDRLLLLKAVNPSTNHRFWLTPGGALEGDEGFEAAARRELLEETGFSPPIGPWVWTRRYEYEWRGQQYDQYERFFVARGVTAAPLSPNSPDRHVVGHRWWSQGQIAESTDRFSPPWLVDLVPAILRSDYPDSPIDCQV